MPSEPNGNETPVPKPARRASSSSERTEAKFFEDVEKIVAEAERLGADYQPPNAPAKLANLKAKRDAALAARAALQASKASEEQARNSRENLFKPLTGDVTSLVAYAKAAGKAENEIAALQAIARAIRGGRAAPLDPNNKEASSISVSNLSYVTRADNYAQFIEQYDALGIETTEDFYKAAAHRAKQAALAAANTAVITAEAGSNTSNEQLDKLAYTDADSLLHACISAKAYIKSKYKTNGQPYKNIAKTRFALPSRLR
jgi:hypothetical protein